MLKKDPITSTNRIYYDLQFLISLWDNMDVATIQCLCLTEFIKLLYLVDELTIILPYKSYFVLKEEVLVEPDKLGLSFTAVSKYFQGSSSLQLNETIYVSILIRYDSP